MRKCAVRDCGLHFHAHCRRLQTTPDEEQTPESAFVCPRHTCATCGGLETDMKQCQSCSVCSYMTHLCCPRPGGRNSNNSSSSSSMTSSSSSSSLEPALSQNLYECPRHDKNRTKSMATVLKSRDASNSLRMRLAVGDAVLVLEFDNALLPSSVKTAAPDTANHWGVVISAEETEPRGCGNQLLNVRMFADDKVLVVPNQYALRTATAADFARSMDFVRHCLQRHAMVELQLRHMEEGNVDDDEAKRIVQVSNAAFAARLKALEVTPVQATSDAEQGLLLWRRFQNLAELRQYDGLGDAAPAYLYIDTRGSRPEQHAPSSVKANGVEIGVDRDMSVRGDAGPHSGGAAVNGVSSGMLHLRRPQNAGRSLREAKVEQATNAMLSGTHLTQSLPGGSPLKQLHTNTLGTALTTTQDAQPENKSRSWAQARLDVALSHTASAQMTTTHSSAAGSDVNNNKCTTDSEKCAGSVKRQKLHTQTSARFSTADCASIDIQRIRSGGTLNSSSTSATTHISPVASNVRKLHPQIRKLLIRKQKLLAETPPPVIEELERAALCYLEEADGSTLVPTRIPTDADAFPWAARASSFRPAFYRPTVMLGYDSLHRSGFDDVSRLLVSQDKRSIKCFVQIIETDARMPGCSDLGKESSSVSPGFVLLDLLTLRSFRDLESVVRARLVGGLVQHPHYTREHLGTNVHRAQRLVEQQCHKKTRDQLSISLTYCNTKGVSHHVDLQKISLKPSPKDTREWLGFCANVRHVSVVITMPSIACSIRPPITTTLQQSAVAK
uniref:Zinc finger PHD-type domain-containing protein n=1 Tax=Hyaloperonospora arabidopsidis (strain Emoy2) TaxID=559515 RepID=M4C5V3_HYAAE